MLDPIDENFRLKFWPQCLLMRSVQFYSRNPGLNLDPGSANSSRIAPLETSFFSIGGIQISFTADYQTPN
jgi:hypothetical protein